MPSKKTIVTETPKATAFFVGKFKAFMDHFKDKKITKLEELFDVLNARMFSKFGARKKA